MLLLNIKTICALKLLKITAVDKPVLKGSPETLIEAGEKLSLSKTFRRFNCCRSFYTSSLLAGENKNKLFVFLLVFII